MLCTGFTGWPMENIPTHLINFNVIKNTMKITESDMIFTYVVVFTSNSKVFFCDKDSKLDYDQ